MNKKLGVMLVPLLLMLVASFGYAAWTDSIKINATATTGNVEFRILAFGVCNKSDQLQFTGEGDYNSVESIDITISNTYPGAYAYFALKVKNTGTISVKLYRMRIVHTGGNAGWMSYYKFAIPTGDTWCQIGSPVYFKNDLNWWSTWREYGVDLPGVPNPPILPGTEKVLGGYFELDSGAPQVENDWISVRLELEVIQAVP